MLILHRDKGEEILITHAGVEVRITVQDFRKQGVKIGIEAPQEVVIYRRELIERAKEHRGVGQESGGSDAASRQEP